MKWLEQHLLREKVVASGGSIAEIPEIQKFEQEPHYQSSVLQ